MKWKMKAYGRLPECNLRCCSLLNRGYFRNIVVTVVAVLVTGLCADRPTFADDTPCQDTPERLVVDAILNADYQHAKSLIGKFSSKEWLIPSSEFYTSLATWHQGYQSQNQSLKSHAIAGLRRAIKTLEARYQSSGDSLTSTLALGLSLGHGARILIENKQFLIGYGLAKKASRQVSWFLENADSSIPGYADASLLQGIIEIHTANIQNSSHWIVGKIGRHGNRGLGITMLEHAINKNAVFTNEAVRTLISELSWNTPDICRYRQLTNHTAQRLYQNIDLAILRMGLQLKCGYPKRAKLANQEYQEIFASHPQQIQFQKAKLRIYANLGLYKDLSEIELKLDSIPEASFAIANAMDVAGLHQQAIDRYRKLIENDESSDSLIRAAQIRLRFPYYPPKRITIPQFKFTPRNTCQ